MSLAAKSKKNEEKNLSNNNIDLSVLDSKLGYHVRILDRQMSRDFVQKVGITQVQFSVLCLVATNENLSQVAIGETLNMDRASTMAIVHKLEDAGYLRRQKSEHDKRVHALKLTKKGSKDFEILNKKVTEYDKQFSARLTASELATFYKCISKIVG